MKIAVVVGVFVAAVGAGLLPAGCAAECKSADDCGADQQCTDGICRGISGGPSNPGGGGGSNNVDSDVDLRAPASMLIDDPSSAGALLGVYDAGAGIDEMENFNLATGADDEENAVLDFIGDFNNDGGAADLAPCKIDSFFVLDSGLNDDDDEHMWITCAASATTFVMPSNRLLNETRALDEIDPIELAVFLPRDGEDDPAILGRALVARRGGTALSVIQFRDDNDATTQPYALESVAGSFGAIAGLFVVRASDDDDSGDANLGDVVLVFDRGTGGAAKLVPVFRERNTETWSGSSTRSDLATIDLPANTVALHYFKNVGIANLDTLATTTTQKTTPNVLAIVPGESSAASLGEFGVAHFLRLETYVTDFGAAPINSVALGFDAAPSIPPATERILLSKAPGTSDTFFYVVNGTNGRAVRFPTPEDDNDDVNDQVLGADFTRVDTGAYVNGMVPFNETRVWLSFSNFAKIRLVEFDDQFR